MLGRRLCTVAAALTATLTMASPRTVADDTLEKNKNNSLEYAVKATYLYKFGPFIRWPESAFSSPTSPFNICVVGHDPFGEQLDSVVRGEQFGTHAIVVRRLETAAQHAGCHVLYITGSKAAIADAVQQVKGSPVLTVTETDRDTAPTTGIINFVIQGNRVRFEVDNESASENDLVLSSKLLSLASSVTPKSAERPK